MHTVRVQLWFKYLTDWQDSVQVWLIGRRGPREWKNTGGKMIINPSQAVGRHSKDLQVNQVQHI